MSHLSHKKYKILKRAAEIEQIQERLLLIRDINAAFNCDKDHIKRLQEEYKALTGYMNLKETADKDWKERLARFAR